jgi:hypothetical protein
MIKWLGITLLLIAILATTVNRFSNPEKTETQLFLDIFKKETYTDFVKKIFRIKDA